MSTPPTYKPLEIEVTDFGPIAKAKLDLRPLTVFVGPSNTGKSYLAMLIYALHRFFSGYAPNLGPRDSVGSSVFDSFADNWGDGQEFSDVESAALLAWMNRLYDRSQGQSLPTEVHARVPDDVAALLRPLLREVHTLGEFLNDEVARCFGSQGTVPLIRHGSRSGSKVVLKRSVSDMSPPVEPLFYALMMEESGNAFSSTFPDTTPLQLESQGDHLWLQLHSNINRLRESTVHAAQADQYERWHASTVSDPQQNDLVRRYAQDMRRSAHSCAQALRNKLVSVVGSSIVSPLHRVAYYLPADRAALMDTRSLIVSSLIRRSMRTGLERGEALPALSGVLADFLEKLVVFEDYTQREQIDGWNLARMLEIEILKGELRENRSETGQTTFTYRPAGRTEEIPVLQASSMVSEIAPVILYLRQVVKPGDVLIIEEPEAHLHPAMQAAFTRQLAAVVRAGVRVMITTHSDYVLEELANLVRMSELPETEQASLGGADFALRSEEVGVWLFEPKKRPKGTVVKEIQVDLDAGTFPAGYGDVTEALYNEWAEVNNRIEENKPIS